MKIIREKEKIETIVGKLEWGDMFYYRGNLFRLEFPFDEDDPYYFNLSEGGIIHTILPETKVTKVTFIEEDINENNISEWVKKMFG